MTHYVIQDGAQFWVYNRNPHDRNDGNNEATSMVEYTGRPVNTLAEAREARAWFVEHAGDIIGGPFIFLLP